MLKDINDVNDIFILKQWIECILSENYGNLIFIFSESYMFSIIIYKNFEFKLNF
jgi:hypothetical protein